MVPSLIQRWFAEEQNNCSPLYQLQKKTNVSWTSLNSPTKPNMRPNLSRRRRPSEKWGELHTWSHASWASPSLLSLSTKKSSKTCWLSTWHHNTIRYDLALKAKALFLVVDLHGLDGKANGWDFHHVCLSLMYILMSLNYSRWSRGHRLPAAFFFFPVRTRRAWWFHYR